MKLTDPIKDLPVCNLAIPGRTGPHAVGTTSLRLPLVIDSNKRCSARIQLWYPVENPSAGRPMRALDWLSSLTHPAWAPAQHGAPLATAQGKFPLIVYVPDLPGRHDDNTFALANLASHGFILAAIDKPFRAARSHIGAGRAPADSCGGANPTSALYERRVRCGVKVATALLDSLQELTTDGPGAEWAGRFDLDQVGILGYAMGGGVAAESTLVDRRYVAAANLGGTVCRETILVEVPYLLVLSDFSMQAAAKKDGQASNPRVAEYWLAQRQSALPRSHIMEIAGTMTEHFSDRLIFPSPVYFTQRRLPAWERIRAIIDSYTAAFFRTYLRSQPHPLVCVKHSPYEQVHFLAPTGRKSVNG